MTVLEKVISGGQTGADRAALEIAKAAGFATGGWVPRGFLTENGPDVSLQAFGCREHPSSDWLPRTIANVHDADGTLIFFRRYGRGSRRTIVEAEVARKPYLCNPSTAELLRWLRQFDIRVLNVAGTRASHDPSIGALVRIILGTALMELRKQASPPGRGAKGAGE
jgi:putative molybdenum carrier protein